MRGTARSVVSFVIACAACTACGGPPASDVPSAQPQSAPGADGNAAAKAVAPASAAPRAWPFAPAQTAEVRAAQLERLKKDHGPIKSNWVPPGKSERYGHAEGLIAATPIAVRDRLADYTHFKDLAGPKFKSVRVVEKQPQGTDLYFQLPIMKGLFTLWYVTRFAPPRFAEGGGEVIDGTFVKGNIKGMHIAFTVRQAEDAKSTVLVCDLLLSLAIPAPEAAVDEELRDACGDAINAVRAKLVPPVAP